MFTIEKDVPFKKVEKSKYPFDEMEVGDSFVIPPKHVARVRQAAYHEKRKGKKFISRKQGEVYRIWRVS